MAATRRELLAGLGAGLVAMQGGALAADGEAIAAARRQWATVGDIERLEREIRDVNQRMQNALARSRRTGFGPSPLPFVRAPLAVGVTGLPLSAADGSTSQYCLPFPGSIIALSISCLAAPTGTPGVDYYTLEATINDVDTGCTVVLDAGDTTGYAVFDKGEATFTTNDLLRVEYRSYAGAPGSVDANVLLWVSFT